MEADHNEEQDTMREGATQSRRTPPYISYSTFKTVLSNFKSHDIPPKIDKSVFPTLSFGVQNQVMLALRALDLIDDDRVPTPFLEALVQAHETDAYASELNALLRHAYPYVFDLDLMTATPSMFADAFKNNTSAKEDVLRKCRTFFLNAARDANVPMGTRLEKASFPRARSNGPKKSRRTKPKGNQSTTDLETLDQQQGSATKGPLVDKLLEKFPEFDPSWPDEIKKQWFEGFERFMSGAGVSKDDQKKGDAE